jgi:hypothetical protein
MPPSESGREEGSLEGPPVSGSVAIVREDEVLAIVE